jgi:hypothetical protein
VLQKRPSHPFKVEGDALTEFGETLRQARKGKCTDDGLEAGREKLLKMEICACRSEDGFEESLRLLEDKLEAINELFSVTVTRRPYAKALSFKACSRGPLFVRVPPKGSVGLPDSAHGPDPFS